MYSCMRLKNVTHILISLENVTHIQIRLEKSTHIYTSLKNSHKYMYPLHIHIPQPRKCHSYRHQL